MSSLKFSVKRAHPRDLQMMALFENECSLSGGYNQKIKKNHTFLKMTLRAIVYSKTSLKYFLWFDRLTSFKIMYRINNLQVFLYLAIEDTEKPGWLVLVLVASRRCPRRWWWWLNFRSITWRRGCLIRRNISDGLLLLASRTCSRRHWWWLIHRRIP